MKLSTPVCGVRLQAPLLKSSDKACGRSQNWPTPVTSSAGGSLQGALSLRLHPVGRSKEKTQSGSKGRGKRFYLR